MKNFLIFILVSASLFTPLTVSALTLRCEHVEELYFHLVKPGGQVIPQQVEKGKEDDRSFSIELDNEVCKRRNNNPATDTNPFNNWDLLSTDTKYFCTAEIFVNDEQVQPILHNFKIDRYLGEAIGSTDFGLIRTSSRYKCEKAKKKF